MCPLLPLINVEFSLIYRRHFVNNSKMFMAKQRNFGGTASFIQLLA